MKEELEKLVLAGKLNRHHLEPLVQMITTGFCVHRSWGCGKIAAVDTVFARITIDFPAKPGHIMDLAFAAESLKPIPSDHILARKLTELGALQQMAALHHLDLIKLVLQSYAGKVTVDQIQQVLVPDVIAHDWKKWWEVAKREMKKDGHFQVPIRKSEPIVYQAQGVSLQDRLLAEFRGGKGLKARVTVALETLKCLGDLTDKQALVSEMLKALNSEIGHYQRTQPALALEAVFARDDLRQACGLPPLEDEVTPAAIWALNPAVGTVLEAMPASKHKRALQSFQQANPTRWPEALLACLNTTSAKVCSECAAHLVTEGHLDALKQLLARIISQHTASSELLLWLAKERSDTFADILGPEVFRAMLTALERDQFNEKRSIRLRDYILDEQELLVELIESADIDVIKDLTRALRLSPAFDDMDKRSLLARIVKSFPSIQSLISGEHTKEEGALIVSWDSLEQRRNEYNELVHKRIPANSRDIALARSYGDLRENHEYKAAKEMHKLLMRRKAELENQLARACGTDFRNARTDIVGIGTIVSVTDLSTQHRESYTILGAWDFDAERHIISYLSPIGQAFVGKKIGEETEFDVNGVRMRFRIDAIHPYQPASEPASQI
jgi:transcription elongation GreA/GreB family factor